MLEPGAQVIQYFLSELMALLSPLPSGRLLWRAAVPDVTMVGMMLSSQGLHELRIPPVTLLHGTKTVTPHVATNERAAAPEDATKYQDYEGKP
jgi:hypothetical protein